MIMEFIIFMLTVIEFIIFMFTTHVLDLKIGYYFSSLFLLITLLLACNTNF